MPLTSPRFASNERLQAAAINKPALWAWSSGEAVRIVQQALIDLGYQMPISVKKHGSPDGIYGDETVETVRRFQANYSLKIDGVTGKQVMTKLDELLPTSGKPLPPAPKKVPYRVPGIIDPIKQPSKMSCWATSYTMMLNWKRQMSFPIEEAMKQLGQKWVDYYDANKGLPPKENIPFALAAHLQYEPLMSLSIDAWADLLRAHGPLWFLFGWETAGLNGLPSKKGRHILVITGIEGDGTPDGTTMRFIDPGDGQYHNQAFMDFIADYEKGFTVSPNMSPETQKGFSQILHF